MVAKNEIPKQHGEIFNSISICLSKGLGCPVGSVLIGKKEFIKKARRTRKILGGGMRQAGFIAAAGIYALQNNIERLKQDHANAKHIGEAIAKSSIASSLLPIETNIIIFETTSAPAQTIVDRLKENKMKL